MVDVTELREQLDYSKDTGILTWKVSKGQVKEGDIAGTITHKYLQVCFNKVIYLAHRLIWIYVHGTEAPNDIDHINGNTFDNRLCNLRVATRTENNYNRKLSYNKTSYRGVYISGSKYASHIKINKVTVPLGTYNTPEEAAVVYENKAKEVQGEFYYQPEYLSSLQNILPKRIIQTNITRYTGVNKSGSRYRAQIKVNNVKLHLGTFNTPEEAYIAYLNKKKELGRV